MCSSNLCQDRVRRGLETDDERAAFVGVAVNDGVFSAHRRRSSRDPSDDPIEGERPPFERVRRATSSWSAAAARLGILSKASARTARVNSLSNALRQGRFLTSLPVSHRAQLELPQLCVVAEISHCLRLSVR